MALFAKHAAIFAKRVAFLRQKAPQFVDCTRIVALHKTAHCGVAIKVRHFGGRKAARMPPCFQVPLRHVCCILLDAYRKEMVIVKAIACLTMHGR